MDLEEWVWGQQKVTFRVRVGVKKNHLCRYKIRGDDEEWEEVLKKAGSTAVISIKRCSAFKGSSFYWFYTCLTLASLPTVTRRGSWQGGILQPAMEAARMGSWRRQRRNTASSRKTRTNGASLEGNCKWLHWWTVCVCAQNRRLTVQPKVCQKYSDCIKQKGNFSTKIASLRFGGAHVNTRGFRSAHFCLSCCFTPSCAKMQSMACWESVHAASRLRPKVDAASWYSWDRSVQKTPLSSVCNTIKRNISHVNFDFSTVIVLFFFFTEY